MTPFIEQFDRNLGAGARVFGAKTFRDVPHGAVLLLVAGMLVAALLVLVRTIACSN